MIRSRHLRVAVVLGAAAVLALLAGGCGFFYKEGSMQVSQPKGVGAVRVHLNTCSIGFGETEGLKEERACIPNDAESQPAEAQEYVAFALPPGTVAPATVTAVGIRGGAPTETFFRSEEAAAAFAAWHPEAEEGEAPWPPAGAQIVAYASGVEHENEADEFEWSLDPEFTPPAAGTPFTVTAALASRAVEAGEYEPDRPLDCTVEEILDVVENGTFCEVAELKTTGTSKLDIAPPAAASLLPGGSAALTFPATLTTSVTPPPAFALSAATGIPGATATPVTPALAGSSAAVAVKVPATAKPGAYPVTLTATAAGGGTVSQTGSVTVVAAKLKFGKVKLNKKKGTALVSVTVPSGGTLNVSGKGFTKVTKKAGAAKTLKVTLKAKGPTAAALATVGKATLKPTFKFKPANGAVVSKPRTIVLKLSN